MIRAGIDIGGTFTDLAIVDDETGAHAHHKRLTNARHPARGALEGLVELVAREGRDLAECGLIVHATTLVTNAVLERRGAHTGLLTTEGFRDVLELGREQRYDTYDLFQPFGDPLVPRQRRLEVRERLDRDGREVVAIDLDHACRQAQRLVDDGVEAIAVCLLHSYASSRHELQLAAMIEREFPAVLVTTSAEVVPEIGEYERTCTTVCNAFVMPLVDRYLAELESGFAARGFEGQLLLMQSAGGLMTSTVARRLPVRLLESGPAAGGLFAGSVGGCRLVFRPGGPLRGTICVTRFVAPRFSTARAA